MYQPTAIEVLKAMAVGRPGRPSLLDYYHDGETCENPECCGHCILVVDAKAAIAAHETA